ncbi:MAG: site-2 protease family protein [Pseudarcicella sp.]|nr:site-2 protease family protein [Pseudarcicella sp.]
MRQKTIYLQILLFVLTLLSTTLAGAELISGKYFFFPFMNVPDVYKLNLNDIYKGLPFSIPFLGILTVHEFGHYFTAKYYKIKVSLPYYIPMWLSSLAFSIGTMGAVIQIKDKPKTRQQYFDIGIAGPLAGFVLAMICIIYGFTHLPPMEYLYNIHPEYAKYGGSFAKYVYHNNMEGQIVLGDNLIFYFFRNYIANPTLVPNQFEIVHYPLLMAGYLGLFFTSLNLLPIGQLDGGHILFGLLKGKKFNTASFCFLYILTLYAGFGIITINDLKYPEINHENRMGLLTNLSLYLIFLWFTFSKISKSKYSSWIIALSIIVTQLIISYFITESTYHFYGTNEISSTSPQGYTGFLVFALILGRFLGINHPQVDDNELLDTKRKILAWISLVIFILSFSPMPFVSL